MLILLFLSTQIHLNEKKTRVTIKHKNQIIENISWYQIVASAKLSKHLAFMLTVFRLRCLLDNINGRVQEIMGMKFGSQVAQLEFY